MLKVIDIHVYYGESYVLQGISLEVTKGSVMSILGRNGVGKTTLIYSIIGFTPPRRGRILFQDIDITHMPSYKIVRGRMGLVPQGRRIFPSLTVKENLDVVTQSYGSHQWDLDRLYDLFPRLQERHHHKGNELSGGEQQMLAIARALISNPLFILMDEPTEGLAPLIIREIRDIIFKLKDEGLSLLIAEQNFSFALQVGSKMHVMNKGRIVHSSNPKELSENYEIKSKYLGV